MPPSSSRALDHIRRICFAAGEATPVSYCWAALLEQENSKQPEAIERAAREIVKAADPAQAVRDIAAEFLAKPPKREPVGEAEDAPPGKMSDPAPAAVPGAPVDTKSPKPVRSARSRDQITAADAATVARIVALATLAHEPLAKTVRSVAGLLDAYAKRAGGGGIALKEAASRLRDAARAAGTETLETPEEREASKEAHRVVDQSVIAERPPQAAQEAMRLSHEYDTLRAKGHQVHCSREGFVSRNLDRLGYPAKQNDA